MEDTPINSFSIKKMSKKIGQISNFIRLLIKDIVIVTEKGSFEKFFEFIIINTESLSKQTKESLIDSVHHTAF